MLNVSLLYCRRIPYSLSHQGSPSCTSTYILLVFLTKGLFAPLGTFSRIWRLLVVTTGARLLLGISQGRGYTFYNTQGKPHPTQSITQPKTSTVLSLTNSGLHWWHKYSKERFNRVQHISYKTNLWHGCFFYYASFVAVQGIASFLELKIISARRKCKIINLYIHQASWFLQWDKDEPLLNTCHASGIHSTLHKGFHLNLTATCKSCLQAWASPNGQKNWEKCSR